MVRTAQAYLEEIEINLGVTGEDELTDLLGLPEDAVVVGHDEPQGSAIADGSGAERVQRIDGRQRRYIGLDHGRWRVRMPQVGGEPLRENDRLPGRKTLHQTASDAFRIGFQQRILSERCPLVPVILGRPSVEQGVRPLQVQHPPCFLHPAFADQVPGQPGHQARAQARSGDQLTLGPTPVRMAEEGADQP